MEQFFAPARDVQQGCERSNLSPSFARSDLALRRPVIYSRPDEPLVFRYTRRQIPSIRRFLEPDAVIKKSVLFLLALIITCTIAAYLFGSLLPEERTIVHNARINASPELIHDVAIDASGQRSWQSDVLDITMKNNDGG